MKNLLVTGGAGFIGTNFIFTACDAGFNVLNIDKLTYAGNKENLSILNAAQYSFVQGDICDRKLVTQLLEKHNIDAVVHLAAESHVDRSIDSPGEFVRTNIQGTFELLEASRKYAKANQSFRFLHVSTDEVFGSLGESGRFNEETPYAPNSPYAASKAAADHLVRAYNHTYQLATLTTNCSNNYGPFQFPEKLIPLITLNALEGRLLPIYGSGKNVRDWIYVEDHCQALLRVLEEGVPGATYAIGSDNEKSNIEIVSTICSILQDRVPAKTGSFLDLITYVEDRPGHDWRYAIDATKITKELGWRPLHTFEEGLSKTISWYQKHTNWCAQAASSTETRARIGLKS